MASVKDLRKSAKAAGLKGYSKWNKTKLEKALAASPGVDETPSGPVVEESGFAPIGVPNDPDQVNDQDMRSAEIAAKAAAPPVQGRTRFGIPTEPKRGGVTAGDMNIATGGKEGKPEPAEPAKVDRRPSHTGQPEGIGVPTEPDRGGLNALERKLAKR